MAIATDAGMFRFDTQSCKVEPLCGEMQPGLQGYRTNDGKCDPRGRFLVGTMLYTCALGLASLVRLVPPLGTTLCGASPAPARQGR